MKKVALLILTIIALLLSACGQTPGIESPTEAPITLPSAMTNTPIESVKPTKVPQSWALEDYTSASSPVPSALPSPTPELLPGEYPTVIQLGDPLPDNQPWLLVEIDQEPYLISEDGEHQINLDMSNYFSRGAYLNFETSPNGKMVAVIVRGTTFPEANLYLWSLVENSLNHITSVMGDQNLTNFPLDELSDIYESAGRLAWSHDGSKLAFTSAHLGATTDLYVYDLNSEEILWLTSGPTLAVNPVWSPDDAYILHAGVEKLHIGASGRGYSGWKFFSASPDGSRVHTLAAGGVEERGDEEFLGWVSDRQMLMHSGYWYCGWFDLRMMNIVTGEEYFIWKGYYNEIAYSSKLGLALVNLRPDFYVGPGACGLLEKDPGLYFLSIPDELVTKVKIEPGYYTPEIINGELPFFIKKGRQWYTIDEEGNLEEFDGNPHLPEQLQKYENQIDQIYGWVSSAGLKPNEYPD